jgi:serine/threonine protein kinase
VEELVRSDEEAGNAPVLAAADSVPSSFGVTAGHILNEMGNLEGLVPGTQLGPYKIEDLLGTGGMGHVFRATDRRLSRQVAIKVLLPVGQGPGASTDRVLQEARAASALNHPNIVTVHDIGFSGELAYIVMELVQGQTLRDVMAPGPLSIPKVLDIATQVGDALAAAHAKGIVHRDLKPANVMITSEGTVKVLDFGLAKRTVSDGGQLERNR